MSRNTAVASAFVLCWAASLAAAVPDGETAGGTQQSSPAASAPVAKDATAPKSAPEAPKKQDLSSWWEKNSLEYSPLPAQWLFHAAGSLSYMNAAGNTSGTTFDTSDTAEVRKSRFTSRSFAQFTKRNVTYGFGGGTIDFTERTLREQVDVDLKWFLKAVGGFEDYQNTMIFMNQRRSYYGGLGATVWRNPKSRVSLTMGLGHSDFVFDRVSLMRINPGATGLDTSPGSGGHMGQETFQWKVSKMLIISQDAGYMRYFNGDLGYRWTFNANGNVPINRHISFTLTYRFKVEDNTIIQALRVKTQDRTFLMGIRFST